MKFGQEKEGKVYIGVFGGRHVSDSCLISVKTRSVVRSAAGSLSRNTKGGVAAVARLPFPD